MQPTAHTTSTTAGALAEQQHLLEKAAHPDTELAFQQLAARYAPSVTAAELTAHQHELATRSLPRTC